MADCEQVVSRDHHVDEDNKENGRQGRRKRTPRAAANKSYLMVNRLLPLVPLLPLVIPELYLWLRGLATLWPEIKGARQSPVYKLCGTTQWPFMVSQRHSSNCPLSLHDNP